MVTTLMGLEFLSPYYCDNLLCLLHIHRNKQPWKCQTHSILISTHIFYLTIGPLVWIQILLTLLAFIFIVSPTPLPPRFCLVFSSIFITEFELKLYGIFSPCRELAHSLVRTHYFHSFTSSLASIFSSVSST